MKSLFEFHTTFRRALGVTRPDILHLHSSFAGAVCRASMMFSFQAPRVVYCSHGWAFDRGEVGAATLKKRVIITVEKILALRTDLIINISAADQRSALGYGIGAGKSAIVYNGVADFPPPSEPRSIRQALLGMESEKINVLFVGRFDHQKGFDVLLDAFRQLDPAKYHLHAIGDFVVSGGASTAGLANTSSHVSFLGWKGRDELPPYFAAADVVVMPSRWEGFGLVAAEAMRMETPVLATAVGALPELVKDRISGRLIPSGSSDDIVRVLREENKDSWGLYGNQARSWFLENFTSTRLNNALSEHYLQLKLGSLDMEVYR